MSVLIFVVVCYIVWKQIKIRKKKGMRAWCDAVSVWTQALVRCTARALYVV